MLGKLRNGPGRGGIRGVIEADRQRAGILAGRDDGRGQRALLCKPGVLPVQIVPPKQPAAAMIPMWLDRLSKMSSQL